MPTGTDVSFTQPYPNGYKREGFAEMWGWKELLEYSGREATTVRQMRGQEPEAFPEPVAVISATPIYLAAEVREYFDNRPRQRTRVTPEIHDKILQLTENGMSQAEIAVLTDLHVGTVARWQRRALQD